MTMRLTALCALAMSIACGGTTLLPEIDSFSPAAGTPGTRITIQGQNFDRDGAGYVVEPGTAPWQVYLIGPDRRYQLELEDATDHGLVAVVPEGAVGGTLALAQGGEIITQTQRRFEVQAFPVIRVANDAQYDVVDLRLNGEQVLTENHVLESGAMMRVTATPDRYRVEYAIGELRAPWMREEIHGVEVVALGSEIEVRIPQLHPLDMLTTKRATTDWVAQLKDLRDQPMTYTMRVYGDGAWALFVNGAPVDQGTLVTEPIGPYARSTMFRTGPTGPSARIGPPFGEFDLENGPAHWRLLHYVRAQ